MSHDEREQKYEVWNMTSIAKNMKFEIWNVNINTKMLLRKFTVVAYQQVNK